MPPGSSAPEQIRKPEVMSPGGHWPQLRAAVEAGADAVYFGLQHFSARAKVGFTLAELPEVMKTLHGRGVRGYLTFNTLVFEHELGEAARAIAAAAESGLDALIVQDVGILRLARAIAPELELHASTQMSITDAAGVRFARDLGVDRVTLARELSIKEVRAIYEETGCDLEIFVHGALCVAYSGQCFSSEAWGGRSANRGQCAQACRLSYDLMVDGTQKPLADARYLLSPGDLCTVPQVPEIMAAGVSALKIEGRYKDADYVALTTRAYRAAVDGVLVNAAAEAVELEQVYSRGLGPWFVNGTNHQTVVRGRAPRHRGVRMGRVVEVDFDRVVIASDAADSVSPLKPGDGVVFDAADWRSPGEPEEGGRVYEVAPHGNDFKVVTFANGAIRFDRIRIGDILWRTDDPVVHSHARQFTEAQGPVQKQRVDVQVFAHEGLPLSATWTCGTARVTVESLTALSAARNQGLTAEVLREQFGRLGNTCYVLGEVALDVKGAPFVPASLLNQLRRDAVERLRTTQSALRPVTLRDPISALSALIPSPAAPVASSVPLLHLLVRTPEQLEAALSLAPDSITLDYLDLYGLRPSVERVKAAGIPARVASPRVLKPGEARIVNFLQSLDCQILVRATGILHTLGAKPTEQVLIGDFSLNTANSITAKEYLARGVSRLTPGHDLNAAQITDLARSCGADRFEVIAYQHLPVFHTEHCVFCRFLSTGTSYKDCGRPCEKHRVELRDQSGRSHPVLADVGCRNTVFGAEAQEASQHMATWIAAGICHYRLEFAHETGAEVTRVTRAFQAALAGRTSFADLQRELKASAPGGITQGSLFVAKDYLSLPILQ